MFELIFFVTTNNNLNTNSGSPISASINGTNITILPNKSALYGNSNHNTNTNNNHVNTNTITVKMTATTTTSSSTTTNKVVPNHGKPNCAPKPPGIQGGGAAVKNGLSPLTTVAAASNGNGRPIVSRAHSMRSPRFVLHRFLLTLLTFNENNPCQSHLKQPESLFFC